MSTSRAAGAGRPVGSSYGGRTKSAADALELAQSQLRAAQDEEGEAELFLESVEKCLGGD